MAYQSLYRKYRPQTFADVVGQGHVTRTIQNALESGRIGHGYLFTGTRGTAKTTVARLLAKALNCESSDRPVREPCNRCPSCIAITAGAAIDVIEMDAASHRGVADMEEVRKAVGFGPMELRYKVFIIDEAHQLSSDAKDAFLKTLEEPPPNVVFILATTEPQSIPITIRSRCQQFDFKRGSLSDITERLRYVLQCEGVTFTSDALGHIARGAEGSYRDSLSLLEQVLAFAPTAISTAGVDMVLGTLDNEMLRRVTDAIAQRNAPDVFALAGELLDAGKEARTLLRTLSLHFRDLLLVSVGGPAVGQELTPEEVGPLQAEARAFAPAEMIRAMEILNEAQGETRWNNQHRLLVELTFLKLMNLSVTAGATVPAFATAPIAFGQPRQPNAQPVNTPPAFVPRVAAPPAAVPVTSPVAPPKLPEIVAAPPSVTPVATVAVPVAAPVTLEPPEIALESLENDTLSASYFADDRPSDEDDEIEPIDTLTGNLFVDDPEVGIGNPEVGISEETQVATQLPTVDTSLTASTSVAASREATIETLATDTEAAPDTGTSVAPAAPPLFTLEDVLHIWPEFLHKSGTVSKMTETMMLQAYPADVQNGIVEIVFKSSSSFDKMHQPKGQEFVRKLLRLCLRVDKVGIRFILNENGGGGAPPPTKSAPREKRRERDPLAQLDTLDASDNHSRGTEGFGAGIDAAPQDYADGYGSGSNGGNGYQNRRSESSTPPSRATAPAAPTPPRAAPPTSVASPAATTSSYGRSPNGSEPSVASHVASPLNGTPPNGAASRASPGDDPLVQEVLSTFGGEIVSD